MQRTGSRIIIWISVIASFCTISGFILTQILQKNLMEVLKIELPLPLWSLLLIIGSFLLIFFFAGKRSKNKKNSQEIIAFKEPRKVTYERAQSAAPLSSRYIQSPTGSISIWVYLHPFGEGIRKLENNRYIVSHDTNNGSTKTIVGQMLDTFSKKSKTKKDEIVNRALRQYIYFQEIGNIRKEIKPYAEAQGFSTEEDLFAAIS